MIRNSNNVLETIFYVGLLLLAASLSLSVFMMSVAQFIILGSWALNGNLLTKLKTAFTSKVVWVLISVFVLHVIGLLWTSDFVYGLNDLRVKLPLLALPVIFFTTQALSKQKFVWLLRIFIAGIFITTVLGWCVYLQIIPKKITNVREISLFVSHIRLSLFICLSVYASIYLFLQSKKTASVANVFLMALVIWFVVFLVLIQSVTGIGILLFTSIAVAIYTLLKNKSVVYKISSAAIIGVLLIAMAAYFNSILKQVSAFNTSELFNLSLKTALGNNYFHDIKNRDSENGHPVWINICEPEMHTEWNKKSAIDMYAANKKGDELKVTLIRFLSSKGLRKDAEGVKLLTVDEVAAIENGIANVNYLNQNPFTNRLYVVAWELHMYQISKYPSGHSVAMRLEFWKTALLIIEKHKWKGVGTGDVQRAFNRMYVISKSPLDKEWWLRAHNQYLTIAVALGIPAMLWFMVWLFLPAVLLNKQTNFIYITFLIAAILSMLTEDTLETQAGVTFFALFNCLYLFLAPQKVEEGEK